MADKLTNHLALVHHNLDTLLQSKSGALPKGFNQTRFLQNCMTVLQDTRDIENVDAKSISRTMLKGAFLGLDFFNKECYAIAYNKKTKAGWVKDVQFQTDYKGELKLAKKYSINPIKDIYAKVVRKGDEFTEEIIGGQQTVNFKPISFNDNEIIGVFAVVLFKDGSMNYDTMSVKDVEETKENFSKKSKEGKFSKAWVNSKGEMYKKTILRRLCKLIELDFDTIEQKEAFEASSEFEVKKDKQPEQTSPFNKAIEVEYEVVNNKPEEPVLTDKEPEQIIIGDDLAGTPFEGAK